jgi:hypothetical protein
LSSSFCPLIFNAFVPCLVLPSEMEEGWFIHQLPPPPYKVCYRWVGCQCPAQFCTCLLLWCIMKRQTSCCLF